MRHESWGLLRPCIMEGHCLKEDVEPAVPFIFFHLYSDGMELPAVPAFCVGIGDGFHLFGSRGGQRGRKRTTGEGGWNQWDDKGRGWIQKQKQERWVKKQKGREKARGGGQRKRDRSAQEIQERKRERERSGKIKRDPNENKNKRRKKGDRNMERRTKSKQARQ